jgi:microcompartment protein CcmK/EutM
VNLARIVGTVVATRKEETITGAKLLVLERLNEKLDSIGDFLVAVDAVGAGEGELVLYASGSSARQTHLTKDSPTDAVVMAIVDSFSVHDVTVYRK